MSTYPLKIKAFIDGRPGHEKQTQGILKWLKVLTEIKVEFVDIEPTLKTDIASWLAFTKTHLLSRANKNNIDIAIGTGRHTHIPLLNYGRKFGAKTITCMSPSPLLINFFDLCLVPDHDKVKNKANIIKTTGPPNLSSNLGKHNKNEGLILLGGICSKHRWYSSEITAMVKSIINCEKTTNWTISSSPRTPEDIIAQTIDYTKNTTNCQFYSYQDTPDGWLEQQYNKCQTVWVTSDSISMVYEAITAGCQVGILPVTRKNKNDKFNLSEQNLIYAKLATRYQDWLRGKYFVNNDTNLNEAERCARIILTKWWPEKITALIN